MTKELKTAIDAIMMLKPLRLDVSERLADPEFSREYVKACEEELTRLRAELEEAKIELAVAKKTLIEAAHGLEWCARDGRMAAKTLSEYPKKWAENYHAIASRFLSKKDET